MKNLKQLMKEDASIAYDDPTGDYDIIDINLAISSMIKWLKLKQEEMFIETVSSMDCEMSGLREETFEALINDLQTLEGEQSEVKR